MKRTAKLPFFSFLALLACAAILLQNCGNNKAVPDGSTITVDPSSQSIKVLEDTPFNFTVTVRYADGTPIPYAIVHISGAFAASATYTNPLYQFYYYPDGLNNPDGNRQVDSGYDAQTNKYGVYQFSIVVFGPSSTFTDSIYVTSGSASGKTDLSGT
jgi:hypothetical protein